MNESGAMSRQHWNVGIVKRHVIVINGTKYI